MAPKTKKSPAEARAQAEEEVAKMLARARDLQFRSQCNDIKMAMKSYPELAPSVIAHLTSLGVDWGKVGCPQGSVKTAELPLLASVVGPVSEVGTSSAGSVHEDSTCSAKSHCGEIEDEAFTDASKDALPTCYTEVRILSVRVMKSYLKMAEPVVFSDHAVRALAPMGKKVVPKQTMLELWEFVFGQASDEAIAAAWHAPGAYAKHLAKLSGARGRLARDLVLPPTWPKDGIYQLRSEGGVLHLHSRLLNIEVPIPLKYLEEVDLATIHVQVNFSERSAIVADASGRLRRQASILMLEGQSMAAERRDEDKGADQTVKEETIGEPEQVTTEAAEAAETSPSSAPEANERPADEPQPPLPPELAALVGSTEVKDAAGAGQQADTQAIVKEEVATKRVGKVKSEARPKKASGSKAAAKQQAAKQPPAKRQRVKG
jgi:hypothetical protein